MIHPDVKIGSLVWLSPSKMSLDKLHLMAGDAISLDNFDDTPDSMDPVHLITVPLKKDCGFYPALVVGIGHDELGDQTVRLSFGERGTFTLGNGLMNLVQVLPWEIDALY